MAKSVRRLYQQFRPQHYILTLDLDKGAKKFKGTVTIDGQKIGPNSSRIVFHQQALTITEATITYHDKSSERIVKVSRIVHQRKYDEVRLHTEEILRSGKYSVQLTFHAKITQPMSGLYPCFYEEDGQERELLATQFESHHAREVFPCIDEPAAKATFDLIIANKKDETVIANTPISTQTINKDQIITSFETTPKMSTYLLAFVVGDIKYLEATTKDGVKIRTYAVPEKVKYTEFALEIAVKCLEFYNSYFGIPYPLGKCDLVALPDFAAGAMENWGCITFREQSLLVDPKNTSLFNKQYVALVVAHELAHQWFGNLVTMSWWTDLWLNEGFASWMEFFAIDKIFPEWQLWVQFSVDEQSRALGLDGLANTHPIEVQVKHPDEIRTIFDAISYSKGASVINMLHHYVGDETFQKGLRYYLDKHAYSNTKTVDLWGALEEISAKPVRRFMHNWTSQPGFPIVNCTVKPKSIRVSQERFFINPEHRVKDDHLWPINLAPTTTKNSISFSTRHKEFRDIETTNMKLNKHQTGFYRVVYNPSHLEVIGGLIKRGKLSAVDRLGVLGDLFETAKAGKYDTASSLNFLNNFHAEDNYAVWDVIATNLGSIKLIMDSEELREEMKPFTRNLVVEQLNRLGWERKETDSHFDRLLRPIILNLAASADEPNVVKKCLDTFSSIKTIDELSPDLKSVSRSKTMSGVQIDPDLRGLVFGTVARLGGKPEYEKMRKLYSESNMSEEKNALVAGLTAFEQPELIKRSLKMINSKHVKLQDVAFWVAYMFLNRHARPETWEWLKDNWKWIEENLGDDLAFYRMPILVARCISRKEFTKKYHEFFTKRMSPALERSYKQGLEIVTYQSLWRDRALDEVMNFFKISNQVD